MWTIRLPAGMSMPPRGGWNYFEPATGWHAPFPGSDNERTTINKIIENRLLNPRFNLKTDYESVRQDLHTFKAHDLNFDPNYCFNPDQPQVKKNFTPTAQVAPRVQGLRQNLAKLAEGVRRSTAGSSILVDWLGAGGQPVPIELANARANTCVTCPLNSMDHDWFFGIPKAVAVAIHEQLKVKNQLAMKVDKEDQLGTCDACGCVLSLKTWVPLNYIMAHTPKAEFDKLDRNCWIRKEK